MLIIPLLVSIYLIDVESALFLNDNEQKIVLGLSEKLKIRTCIFIQTDMNSYISEIKQFSSKFLFATFITEPNILKDFLYEWSPTEYTAIKSDDLIVLKSEDLMIMEEIFENRNTDYLKRIRCKWLILADNSTENVPLLTDYNADVTVVWRTNSTNYEFNKIYTVKEKSFSYNFGSWDHHKGLMNIPEGSIYSQRRDLNGTELVTFVEANCFEKKEHDPRSCEVFEMVKDIAKVMNFKIIESRAQDSIVSEFNFYEGDILGAGQPWPYYILFNDKCRPIFKSTYNWYIKYPIGKLKPDYYLKPFGIDFWSAVVLSIIIGTIFILITEYFIKRFIGGKSIKNSTINSLFIGLETLCNQSGGEEEESISLRIISLSLRIIAIFSIASYGADITSYLTAQNPEAPFLNLKGFLEVNDYHLVTGYETFPALIEENKLPEKEYLYLLRNRSTVIYSPMALEEYKPFLQDVCDGKTVVGLFDNDVYKLNPPCHLYKIEEPLAKTEINLIVKAASPFCNAFDLIITRFFESGVQMRMQNEIYKAPKQVIIKDSFFSVKVEQMVQVLLIPFVGIGLSVGFFILELIYKKIKSQILVQNLKNGLEDVNLFFILLKWLRVVLWKIFCKPIKRLWNRCFWIH